MKRIIALCALLACLPAEAQQVYRWVDGSGRVQHSDMPGARGVPVILVGTQRMNGYAGY